MKEVFFDVKGPRLGKAEFSTQVLTKELWKEFTKLFPEHKDMSWNQFVKYWGDITKTIRQEVVHNPLGVKLGGFTGELKLQYLPYKFLANDLTTSNLLGEKVNHVNLVNKGKVAKIKWERRWAVKFNKMLQFYAFDSHREINKLANEYIKSNPEKLRVARNTLGGKSIWRNLRKNAN